jgi:hypothetical protein
MAIHAHPDDDAASTGAVSTSTEGRRFGRPAQVASWGLAPGGLKADQPGHDPEAVKQLRRSELEASCQKLRIWRLERLGYHDSGMADWTGQEPRDRSRVQIWTRRWDRWRSSSSNTTRGGGPLRRGRRRWASQSHPSPSSRPAGPSKDLSHRVRLRDRRRQRQVAASPRFRSHAPNLRERTRSLLTLSAKARRSRCEPGIC